MKRISNSIIKRVNSLRRKKYRQKYKQYVIEGEKLCKEFLNERKELIEFLIIRDDNQDKLWIPTEINIFSADEKQFNKLSEFSSPDGFMLIASIDGREQVLSPFIVYLDAVRDPGNLGTILRTADWFGLKAIYCSMDTVDVYNSKTIQASMGSVWRVSVIYDSWQNVRRIHDKHQVYKAEMDGANYHSIDTYRNSQKAILIMGNESHGSQIKDEGIINISIPKSGNSQAESLNVAMATGILIAGYYK